jgi:hypothetical protein
MTTNQNEIKATDGEGVQSTGKPASTQNGHPLLALAERCEKAGAPDRELDGAIFEAVNGASAYRETTPYTMNALPVRKLIPGIPDFTASIDAAMTLVPDGWTVDLRIFAADKANCSIQRWVDHKQQFFMDWTGDKHTVRPPALAICAAALRARTAPRDGDRSGDAG